MRSNHLHLVVRYDPTAAADWSADTVYDRWFTLRGRLVAAAGLDAEEGGAAPMLNVDDAPAKEHRQLHVGDAAWIERTRAKLGSLGWFMRELKHFIAVRSNQEDGCKGHFWEARYHSQPLLDQAALAACMVYVDLNPIRARMADTPETSAFVSVQERIQARQRQTTHPVPGERWHFSASRRQRAVAAPPASRREASAWDSPAEAMTQPAYFPTPDGGVTTFVDEAHPRWLLPLRRCVISEWPVDHAASQPPWISRDRYLQLVDETGRLVRAGKCGAISADLADILARLDIAPERWLSAMGRGSSLGGSALGQWACRQVDATRRGLNWLAKRCPLFAGKESVAASGANG